MRLRALRLIRFGLFQDRVLDLASAGGSFHVIHGHNEAGKTTALRAITALLYGFPERSPDAHLFAPRDLRVGATLESASGRRLEVVRRKGRKDTLLDPDDGVLPDAALAPFLGGVSREVFELMFGLDHGRLVEGGRDLLAGRGEIGSALFGAASGLRGVHPLADALASEAGEIWKRNGQTPALNRALAEHKAARARLREATLKPAEWQRIRDARDQAAAQQEEHRRALAALRSRRQLRAELLAALPDLAERAAIRARREALGAVVLLPTDARERRLETEASLAGAALRLRKLADERDRLETELAALDVPEALLALEARVLELADARAVVDKAARDRRDLLAKIEAGEEALGSLLAGLPGRPGPDTLVARSLDAALQARIRETAREGERVRARVETLGETARLARRELDGLRAEWEALPAPRDGAVLRSRLEAAREAVALERRGAELAPRIARERAALAEACAALPGFEGGLAELASLPLPTEATLEVFERRFDALEARRRELAERRRGVQEDLEGVERELEGDAAAGPLPSPEDLRAARARRDGLWKGVSEAWLEGGREEGASAVALAAAFAGAVAEADAIGDRLFDEHERVARRAQRLRRRDQLRGRRVELEEAEAALGAATRELEVTWQAAWQAAAVTPASPREMQAWRRRHAELLARLEACRALETEREAALARVSTHREACLEALRNLDGEDVTSEAPAPSEDRAASREEGLEALLSRAEARLVGLAREAEARARLARDLERAEREAERARSELVHAESARADWQARWGEVIAPLEIGPEALPAEAEVVLDRLERVQARRTELAGFRERVRHIERDAEGFERELEAIVGEACPDLPAGDASRRTLALVARMRAGLADRARRETLRRRRGEVEAELQEVAREREAALGVLDGLVAAAGVDGAAALDAAEQRSADRRTLDERLADVEERLRRSGRSPDELEAAVEGLEAATLASEVEEIDRAIEAQEEAREAANARWLDLERDLRELDGSDRAAEASWEAEQALARIARLVVEYAEKRAAERLLRREIERFSSENQDPILTRSSELFSRITLGRYAGVVGGYSDSDDEPVLLCERASGERVGVEGLSEGTRDQLFLALRLAALERHVRQAEPMPLVVDDILLTFDDPRARVTLELMGELARDYQILFFTHHARLAELAREAIPAERLAVHELRSG